MNDRHACEATFLANLEWMQRAMAAVCRHHHSTGADTEDFASWAMFRLLENDYAILRQFRGESSIRTYLVVVIAMLHREYRVRCWGRWRPSAAARRAGRIAVRLETLVHRDGHTLRETILILQTSGETHLSERQLVSLFASLPRRTSDRIDGVCAAFTNDAHSATAEDLVLEEDARAECITLQAVLDRALASLPGEDRLIIRMRFWEGMTVADIARGLRLPQTPLYRRLDRALASLRDLLEISGLSRHHARSFLAQAAA